MKKTELGKTVGLISLLFYAISFCFGAGPYCIIGYSAQYAGPSVTISFILLGLFCFIVGLPYIEYATTIPCCGFSYKFVEVSWGEYIGFFTGFILTFTFTCAISLQARCWAITLVGNLMKLNIHVPEFLYSLTFIPGLDICLLPIVVIIPLTIIVNRGTKDSSIFNSIIAFLNISVLSFALVVGLFYIDTSKFENYFSKGLPGIFKAGCLGFYIFSGFEDITLFSEESTNVKRDIPVAILVIIIIEIIVNGGLSIIMIGMAPLSILNNEKSLLSAFEYRTNEFFSGIISIGMLISLISIIFGNFLAQVRVYYTMANDGMLPPQLAKLNESKAQYFAANLTCIISIIISVFFGVEILGNTIAIGGLYISAFVVLGLILLRHRNSENILKIGCANMFYIIFCTLFGVAVQNDFHILIKALFVIILFLIYLYLKHFKEDQHETRTFECPFVPEIPLIGATGFLFMAGSAPKEAWYFFGVISIIGLILYFFYGYKHSKIMQEDKIESELIETKLI